MKFTLEHFVVVAGVFAALLSIAAAALWISRRHARRNCIAPTTYPRNRMRHLDCRLYTGWVLPLVLLLPLTCGGCFDALLQGIGVTPSQTISKKSLAQLADIYASVVEGINIEARAGHIPPALLKQIQADSHLARTALESANASAAAGKPVSDAALQGISDLIAALQADRAKVTSTAPATTQPAALPEVTP